MRIFKKAFNKKETNKAEKKLDAEKTGVDEYVYKHDDIARICEVAVILGEYETNCEDLHDFYSDHVKPLFDAWLWRNGEGVYKCISEEEEAYITEYANRVARQLYEKRYK